MGWHTSGKRRNVRKQKGRRLKVEKEKPPSSAVARETRIREKGEAHSRLPPPSPSLPLSLFLAVISQSLSPLPTAKESHPQFTLTCEKREG